MRRPNSARYLLRLVSKRDEHSGFWLLHKPAHRMKPFGGLVSVHDLASMFLSGGYRTAMRNKRSSSSKLQAREPKPWHRLREALPLREIAHAPLKRSRVVESSIGSATDMMTEIVLDLFSYFANDFR